MHITLAYKLEEQQYESYVGHCIVLEVSGQENLQRKKSVQRRVKNKFSSLKPDVDL